MTNRARLVSPNTSPPFTPIRGSVCVPMCVFLHLFVCASGCSRACISVLPRKQQAGVGWLSEGVCAGLVYLHYLHVSVIKCDVWVCLCLIVWQASQLGEIECVFVLVCVSVCTGRHGG